MRFTILLSLLMITLVSCKQIPKNTCECLEEAYVLLEEQKECEDGECKNEVEEELKKLIKHCRHLSWRGSTCSQEEVSVIMKRQKGEKSFWDLGEAITLVLHRPYAPPAEGELDFVKHIKEYLNRFSEKDTTWLLQQGPYYRDSTATYEH